MNSNINFIPGLALARRFYWEAVRPILDADFPDLRHSAALFGTGSEVLGFDTPMSSDHHWGPRAMLFLAEDDYKRQCDDITETFRWKVPHRFLGYPTNFGAPSRRRAFRSRAAGADHRPGRGAHRRAGPDRGQRSVQRLHRPAVRSELASDAARPVRVTGDWAGNARKTESSGSVD